MDSKNEQSVSDTNDPSVGDIMSMLKRLSDRFDQFETEKVDHVPAASGAGLSGLSGGNLNESNVSGLSDDDQFMTADGNESASEMNFCVDLDEDGDSILDDLIGELEVDESSAPPVSEKLSTIVQNRFSQKMDTKKMEEKCKKFAFPENCENIKPPILDTEIKTKFISQTTAKVDSHLFSVQTMIARASAGVVSVANRMHEHASELRKKPEEKNCLKNLNESLSALGDVIAILGTSQQELTIRRRYQLKSVLPKEISSICSTKTPHGKTLFGPEIEKDMRNAKETYKHQSQGRPHSQRFAPYRYSSQSRGAQSRPSNTYQTQQQGYANGGPFLGQGRGYPNRRNFRGRGRGMPNRHQYK